LGHVEEWESPDICQILFWNIEHKNNSQFSLLKKHALHYSKIDFKTFIFYVDVCRPCRGDGHQGEHSDILGARPSPSKQVGEQALQPLCVVVHPTR
jgi:hypothetical protein